jgi:hypothetical protein
MENSANRVGWFHHVVPAFAEEQRFHFEGNFLLKGIFCKMKEI